MEKKLRFIVSTVWYLLIAGMVYLFFKYAIFVVMPFLIGFAAASLINPVVRWLLGRFRLRRRPTAILLLLLFYATIGMLVSIAVVRLGVLVGNFMADLPQIYQTGVEPTLTWLIDTVQRFLDRVRSFFGMGAEGEFFDALQSYIDSLKTSLGNAVSELSVQVLTRLSAAAAGIPRILIEGLIAVLASFFITLDFEEILAAIKKRLPDKAVAFLKRIRNMGFVTAARCLRSYALLALITYGELALGLVILGVSSPLWAALGIALFDFLPVLGTGGILIPWALLSFLYADYPLGIGLLVLWGIISVVRNILEPRIVGRQMGLHPLLALMAMVIGSRLFGLVGLILLPVCLSLALSVRREQEAISRRGGQTD